MFFLSFLGQPNLRGPSVDRRETLPHDWNLCGIAGSGRKIWGLSPKKYWGPKTCKISVDFVPLQILIVNISRTRKHTQNRKTIRTRAVSHAFNKKVRWTLDHYREFHVSLVPLKCTSLGYYILALRVCCAPKFLHSLEIDQGYLATPQLGRGPPPL